jgi:hypothetical protein
MPILEDLGIDRERLAVEVKSGTVNAVPHPSLPITVYNATSRASSRTKKFVRGLILDDRYTILGQPFLEMPEFDHARVSPGRPVIVERIRGKLGILWQYLNKEGITEYGIATRDGFETEETVFATNYIKNHVNVLAQNFMTYNWTRGYTQLFQIVTKKNSDYRFEGLIMVGAVVIGNPSRELPYPDLRRYARTNMVLCVRKTIKPLAKCLGENNPNYIAIYSTEDRNGYSSMTRMKITQPARREVTA